MISIFPSWTFHLYEQYSSNTCIWSIYLSDCASYQDFIDRKLTRKRLNQRFLLAIVYRSPHQWYKLPLSHGILTPLPMVYWHPYPILWPSYPSILRCRSRNKVDVSVFVVSFILSQWDRCSGGLTIMLKHRTPLARGGPSSCQKKNPWIFCFCFAILNLKAFCSVCLTACVGLPDLTPSGPK
jgi:hypothetical protein